MTIESELRVAALVLRNLPYMDDGTTYIDDAEANRCAEVIENALELIEQSQWQPIETAPKDECILAINADTEYKRPHVVRFYEHERKEFQWATSTAPMSHVVGLTHWMPLPKPPTGE